MILRRPRKDARRYCYNCKKDVDVVVEANVVDYWDDNEDVVIVVSASASCAECSQSSYATRVIDDVWGW